MGSKRYKGGYHHRRHLFVDRLPQVCLLGQLIDGVVEHGLRDQLHLLAGGLAVLDFEELLQLGPGRRLTVLAEKVLPHLQSAPRVGRQLEFLLPRGHKRQVREPFESSLMKPKSIGATYYY